MEKVESQSTNDMESQPRSSLVEDDNYQADDDQISEDEDVDPGTFSNEAQPQKSVVPQKKIVQVQAAKSEGEEREDSMSEDSEEEKFNYEVGDVIEVSPKGRFKRFHDQLGEGAYKKVFKGIDEDTGREIAWNVIELKTYGGAPPN